MRFALFIVFACLLCACATRNAPVPVPFDVPGQFSASGVQDPDEWWWEALGDEELNAWMRESLEANFSLRSAWDRLAQAEAVAARQGAALWPSLDANADATRIRREEEGGGRVYRNEFSAGLVARYEVDVWGRIRSARDAAALDVSATAEQVRSAAITLSAEIATLWMQRAEQHGQVTLLEKQLATNQRILTILQQRFRTGQSAAADVLQQEQLVEARRGDLAAARSRLDVLDNQLLVLAGKPVGAAAPTPSSLPELSEMPRTGIPAEVIQRRPDVRRSFLQVQAADERVAAAIADRFPRISLTARAASVEPQIEDLFSNWLASLAGNLAGPVIDGGARRAEVARTRAVLSEAINDYRQAVLISLAEVENALVQERQQRELVESLARQLELATQVSGRLRDRYLSGGEDFLRILTAELSQQTLERTLLTSRRQLIEIRIGLYRALSGGFPLERPAPATLKNEDHPS